MRGAWPAVGAGAARFVCIYRPRTSTEEVADDLRGQIARAIGVDPASLVKNHSSDNFDKEIKPADRASRRAVLADPPIAR